ncbi:MAG: DUF2911 domain-containing protein [Bacteroidota bacterium]
MYAIRSDSSRSKRPFRFLILGLWTIIGCISCQPKDKAKRPSPPAADTSLVQTAEVIIDYSSPAVKERELLDGLIPYNKVWRTGANEATTFVTNKDLLVMGERLPKGRYAFFTRATERSWTILFNTEWDQWGAYDYDETKDILRIEINPRRVQEFKERMTLYFENEELVFHWGHLQYSLELQEASR